MLYQAGKLATQDSGGLQEETTALGVPCVTIRENTERPVTVDEGSNVLAGTDPDNVIHHALQAIAGNGKKARRPALWDGKSAERIVSIVAGLLIPSTVSAKALS